MSDYWKPKYKYELVEWLFDHYEKNHTKSEINSHSKKTLMGWYHDIRRHTK